MPCPSIPLEVLSLPWSIHAPALSSGAGSLVHGLRLRPRCVLPRVYPNVDHGGAARFVNGLARTPQRRGNLRGIAHFLAAPAEHFTEFAERHVAQKIADIAALLAVFGNLAVADL